MFGESWNQTAIFLLIKVLISYLHEFSRKPSRKQVLAAISLLSSNENGSAMERETVETVEMMMSMPMMMTMMWKIVI